MDQTRDQVRYRFFRKKDNAKIYHKIALTTMKDKTPSAFEFQLAMRLMNVGATDEEVVCVYRQWCAKHGLRQRRDL